MKKIITTLMIGFYFMAVSAQSGSGTKADPYWGDLSASAVWTTGSFPGDSVYIGTTSNPDLNIISGGVLTIDPGIVVAFKQLTSDLVITGSGSLNANGNSSDSIIFTKVTGISHWGHITFETPGQTTPITGTGSFSFCRIDYGYTNGAFPNPNSAGGAIQVNAPNVTIDNCTFKNNYARFGGAVTVNASQNTIIRNSIFKDNDATECAGALLLFLNSTSVVENCIFEGNYCAGTSASYYGGGAIWLRQNTSKIINCSFIGNTSPRSGDAFYTYQSSGAKIVNCIFWGSNDQTATTGTAPAYSNCAFESVQPATASNSILLNSLNSAPDGPNFSATDGSDWSLKFISPCLDRGVNSYTNVTIPTTDFLGNYTIYNKDMGAYEVQYSRWMDSPFDVTDWEAVMNWEQGINPSHISGTGDVIIPALSSSALAPAIAGTVTINTGDKMILMPGAMATISTINNSGSLLLKSDATNISSLIVDSYSGNNADVELYLTGGGTESTLRWHYISSPFSTLPVTAFTGVTLDVVGYAEPRVTTDLVQGWVAWDGFVYATRGDDDTYAFSDLLPGKGYDYWDQLNNTFTLSGNLNVGNVSANLSYSGRANSGFNLLGNPFSSGLDWEAIINDTDYPASTSKSLLFTRNNVQCSYINGVGIPGDVTGIIPPMQGFFVKTSAAGNSIILSAGARTNDAIHSRYKGNNTIPLVRLKLSKDTLSDETVVRFDELAKNGLDNDFDALRIFSSPENIGIYSISDGKEFTINGQPFPEEILEIPIVINITSDGIHKIAATQLQGLDPYMIDIIDKTTGLSHRLRVTPEFEFTAAEGLITDRFVLKVSKIITAVDDLMIQAKEFNIFHGFDHINIQCFSHEWDGKIASIRVIDISGRTIQTIRNAEFNQNSIIELPAPSAKGLYLVEIKSGLKNYMGKVIIK